MPTRRYIAAAALAILVVGGLIVALRPATTNQDRSARRGSADVRTTVGGPASARQSSAAAGATLIEPAGAVSDTVARSFAAFRSPPADPRAAVAVDPLLAEAAKVQAAETTEAPSTDFARAVAVPVAGSSLKAWIAPAGHKVCAIVELPDGAGTGGGCSTPEQVRQGDGLTLVPLEADGEHRVVILQIVVDGQRPGTVMVAGRSQAIGTASAGTNAVAGTFAATGELRTGSQNISLEAIREP